jgi:SpoVK/Ycf46/Vps4 family AAA+-type ATPase
MAFKMEPSDLRGIETWYKQYREWVKAGRKPKEGPRSKGDDKPKAVVTVGLPGSGKSTIAKHMVSKGKTDQHELDKSRRAKRRLFFARFFRWFNNVK